VTEAQRSRARLAAQNGAVRALVNAGAGQEAVGELVREVCQNLAWTIGALWLPEPSGLALGLQSAWSDPGADVSAFLEASRGIRFEPGVGLPGRVWASGEPAWIRDVTRDVGFYRTEAARQSGLHGAFAVPVPLGDERRGALEFLTREALEPDRELLETMSAVGGHLGQFLQRRAAEAALRRSEERAEERLRFHARLLDAVGEAVIAVDLDGRILYWNAYAERLFGWQADEVVGRDAGDIAPAAALRARVGAITASLAEGRPRRGEFMVRDRSGREFPVLANDSPILDDDGRLIGVIGTSIDITDRKQREEGQRFLAEAGRVMASSLDHAATLRSVATLAVPYLGDWCLVHVRDAEGRLVTPVARVVPGGDSDDAEALDRLMTRDSTLVEAVMAGDTALVGPSDTGPPVLRESDLRELGLAAVLTVPLRARGTPLGVITFGHTAPGRRYTEMEVAVAEELGRRAGLAIDNARLYREAEEGNRAKADFLAVVSHELRTPLNAIAGYADLLAGGIAGELNPAQERHVERIKVGAGHLAQLIDEILSYARVETGRETVRLETTDLAEIARGAVAVIEPDARGKGLDLRLDAPADGLRLLTDPGKVRQILANLLANAVKYTESGVIRVMVKPLDGGGALEVQDTGIGIPQEARARIFEPFWQAESPNTRTIGGTGLGLSVSRRLARLLDGSVEVESEPGVGSRFIVRIPDLAPVNGPPAAPS
jgi:PAS domain S-box-containing protein